MAVRYKLYKNNNMKLSSHGKWYGRATYLGTIDTNQMADIIQANCTVKKSDVLAVISELVEVMTTNLQNSMCVKLDGFGVFKLGISTSPAASAREFTPLKNVRNVHVLFRPESHRDALGVRNRALLSGVTVKEADEYSVDESSTSGSTE